MRPPRRALRNSLARLGALEKKGIVDTKVDVEALRTLALPWPGGVR